MKIAVCQPVNVSQANRLRLGAGEVPLRFVDAAAPCDAQIMFGNPETDVVVANRALRWLQLGSVGFGEYLGLDWSRADGAAQVTNLAGFFSHPVAETALAGILALRRGIDRLTLLRTRGEWLGDPVRQMLGLVTGSRVVLFGRGAINGRLAEMLSPFHCDITTFGRDFAADALDAALTCADIVVATVPHSPATVGLFDAARIGRMRPGAVFCNLGRGSLVDEVALAAALTSGRLAGAVIDVTTDEPLPDGHAFWTTPNTILTQHSGGGTADEVDRMIDWFLDNLARFRECRPLRGSIDFARGY
jgi:phosphoglycerate dehydrogenase-like enzyme